MSDRRKKIESTDEEQQTIQLIKDTFGPDANKFCILIFTREDDLLFHEQTIEDHIKSSKKLKELVAQCQNRYLAVNNRASKEERDDKIRQLITIIQAMMESNQQQHYTNEDLEKAEKILRKQTEEEMMKKLETEENLKHAMREEVITISELKHRR